MTPLHELQLLPQVLHLPLEPTSLQPVLADLPPSSPSLLGEGVHLGLHRPEPTQLVLILGPLPQVGQVGVQLVEGTHQALGDHVQHLLPVQQLGDWAGLRVHDGGFYIGWVIGFSISSRWGC